MPVFNVNAWIGTVAVKFSPEPFLIERIFLPETFARDQEGIFAENTDCSGPDRSLCREAQCVYDMIRSYFDQGRPLETPWKWICLKGLTRLQRAVFKKTSEIPYGQVRTYGEIAALVERPGAARFVGNTMAANPWPLLIPCHRVIRSDRTVGGFGGGSAMKTRLIEHEADGKNTELAL
ncbi:MAG: MGMT family protein [Desulfobacterales bacterium]|nr:MGMT family protein [Desulfobacterales bacterium]